MDGFISIFGKLKGVGKFTKTHKSFDKKKSDVIRVTVNPLRGHLLFLWFGKI